MKTPVLFCVQIRLTSGWVTLEWARNLPQHEAHNVLAREKSIRGDHRFRMTVVETEGNVS